MRLKPTGRHSRNLIVSDYTNPDPRFPASIELTLSYAGQGDAGKAAILDRVVVPTLLRHFDAQIEPLGPTGRTGRGFGIIEFLDSYGVKSSIQESSSALQPMLWLGPNDASPKIMASQAAAHGVKTDETTGWVPYPVPEAVSLTTRMHLNRPQVMSLIRHLQNWLDDGQVR